MAEGERSYCICSFTLSCFLLALAPLSSASEGDRDPIYRSCVRLCVRSGCIGSSCFAECNIPINGLELRYDHVHVQTKLMNSRWISWDCARECRYQCMLNREVERESFGLQPVKYHGKWPFRRILGFQEPASVIFSLLNLLAHVLGLRSFLVLVYKKLPLRQQGNGGPYYKFTSLWAIYAVFAINSWFWSAIFHSRDIIVTERMDYCSAVAVLGFSLALAIIRTGDLKSEAVRVMTCAPIIAFVATHLLYLSFYDFDYGMNMKVCVGMAIVQLLIWSIWAAFTRHPARLKLWIVVSGGALFMLLEIYDFPPYKGIVDAHSVWHAATVPLTFLWWSFIRDDALFQTLDLASQPKTMSKVD